MELNHKYIAFSRKNIYFLISLIYLDKIVSSKNNEISQNSAYCLEEDLHILDFTGIGRRQRYGNVIIINNEQCRIGLQVDDIEGVVDISEENHYAFPTLLKRKETSFIEKVAVLEEEKRIYIILDCEQIMRYAQRVTNDG